MCQKGERKCVAVNRRESGGSVSTRRKEVCDKKGEEKGVEVCGCKTDERGVAVCQKEERKFVAVNRRERKRVTTRRKEVCSSVWL